MQTILALKSNPKFKGGNLLSTHTAWMIRLSIKENFNPTLTLIFKTFKNLLIQIKPSKLLQKLQLFSK